VFFACIVGRFNRICLCPLPTTPPRAIYLIRDSTQMLKVRFCLLLSRHFIDFPFGSAVSGSFYFLLAFRCALEQARTFPYPFPPVWVSNWYSYSHSQSRYVSLVLAYPSLWLLHYSVSHWFVHYKLNCQFR